MLILIKNKLFSTDNINNDKLLVTDGQNQYEIPKEVMLNESSRFISTQNNRNYNLIMIMMSKMSVRDIYTLISTNNSMLKILEYDNYRSIIDLKFPHALKYQSILSGEDFYYLLFGSPSYVRDIMLSSNTIEIAYNYQAEDELWTNISIHKYLDGSFDVTYLTENRQHKITGFNRIPNLLKFMIVHGNFNPQTCKLIYIKWILTHPEIILTNKFLLPIALSDDLNKIKLIPQLTDEMINSIYVSVALYSIIPSGSTVSINVIKTNEDYYTYDPHVAGVYNLYQLKDGDQIRAHYSNAKKIIKYLYSKSILPKQLYSDISFIESYNILLELDYTFHGILTDLSYNPSAKHELVKWILDNLRLKIPKNIISRFTSLEIQKMFIYHGYITELGHLRRLLPEIVLDDDAIELLTLLLENGAVLKKQDFNKINYDPIDESVIEWLIAHDLFPELKTIILTLKIIQSLMSNGYNINDFSNVKYQTCDLALLKYLYANGITFTDNDLQTTKKMRTSERSRNTRERKKYDIYISLNGNLTNIPSFVPDNTWSDIYDWMVTII